MELSKQDDVKYLRAAGGLLVAMLVGGSWSFLTEIASFDSWESLLGSVQKPLVAMLTLSVFPFVIAKLHPIRTAEKFWGLALLLAFIGWDAVARTGYYNNSGWC